MSVLCALSGHSTEAFHTEREKHAESVAEENSGMLLIDISTAFFCLLR